MITPEKLAELRRHWSGDPFDEAWNTIEALLRVAEAANNDEIKFPYDLDTGQQLDSEEHQKLRTALAALDEK